MADLSDDQLRQLCAALGWQGGTFWQVLEEVKRLIEIAEAATKVLSALDRGVKGCIDPTWAGVQNGRGEEFGVELETGRAALRAALGTLPAATHPETP